MQNYIKNQTGMALVLSVLILANLFVITFIVADIIIRVGKTGHNIGQSEIAYLAAETAIEKSIYQIEADRDLTGLGIIGDPNIDNLVNTNGQWETYVQIVNRSPIICLDATSDQTFSFPVNTPNAGDNLSCIYPENLDPTSYINAFNPLEVYLESDKTFQLELDFDLAGALSCNSLKIEWSSSNPKGEIIVLDKSTNLQTIVDTKNGSATEVVISDIATSKPRLKITNNQPAPVTYTITPTSFIAPLPLSILVHAKGTHGNHERTIEVERRLWQIY